MPAGTVAQEDGRNITVIWPSLLLTSFVGGAAFALGAGLINRFIFSK